MDYLYAQLNQTVDRVSDEFNQTIIANDYIVPVKIPDTNDIELSVNVQNLVRLLPVASDTSIQDDIIQTYQLFGYNNLTALFDIPIGEPIVISHVGSSNQYPTTIKIRTSTGEIAEVKCEVDATGALVLDHIPVAALSDTHVVYDPDSGVAKVVYVESIIDGNDE